MFFQLLLKYNQNQSVRLEANAIYWINFYLLIELFRVTRATTSAVFVGYYCCTPPSKKERKKRDLTKVAGGFAKQADTKDDLSIVSCIWSI